MTSLKQLTTILITLIFVNSAIAQDLLTFVPKDASLVGMVNIDQINTKADFAALIELPFIQEIDKKIAKDISRGLIKDDASAYLDFREYGIKVNSKSYTYFVSDKKMYYGALLFSLSDKNKFTEFVKIITNDLEGEKIATKNNYSQAQKKDLRIIWNNNTAVIFGATIQPAFKDSLEAKIRKQYGFEENEYKYDVYEVEEAFDEEVTEEIVIEEQTEEAVIEETEFNFYDLKYAAIDSIENKWFEANTPQFIQSKGANSYAGNAEFKEYVKSEPEAAFVVDYGLFNSIAMDSYLGSIYKTSKWGIPYNYLMSMYDGMKMFAKIESKKDAIEISYDIKLSKKVNEIFAQVKKKKISKDFLKYMNKDMMGYYALGLDIEGLSEGLKQMFRNTLPEMPEYGKTAVSSMDILDIIIDEKALYNIFTGDVIIAVNGVKELEVIHKGYDYDEEFKRIEIIDTSMQKMPELSLMIGIGNKKDVQKIVDLLVNTKVFKQEGNIYNLDIKNNKLPIHFSISNGILFISNNKKYVQNPAIYSKDQQVDSKHGKMFKKNTFVAYANTAEIARYFADTEGSFKEKKMMTESSNLFKHIAMFGRNKGNFMHSKYIIQLSESNENSIADILKFMNELYIINDKKI